MTNRFKALYISELRVAGRFGKVSSLADALRYRNLKHRLNYYHCLLCGQRGYENDFDVIQVTDDRGGVRPVNIWRVKACLACYTRWKYWRAYGLRWEGSNLGYIREIDRKVLVAVGYRPSGVVGHRRYTEAELAAGAKRMLKQFHEPPF